jgi:hypothetical protein
MEPPWGFKPPAVDDHTKYWGQPPPEPSARLQHWMRRLDEGTWHPNKYIRREDYDGAAQRLGVYIWEYLHVLAPAIHGEAVARGLEGYSRSPNAGDKFLC